MTSSFCLRRHLLFYFSEPFLVCREGDDPQPYISPRPGLNLEALSLSQEERGGDWAQVDATLEDLQEGLTAAKQAVEAAAKARP